MAWIPYGQGNRVSFCERQVRRMLLRLRVRFVHSAFVAGREVDFLIPRPGKRGLIVEVDGDLWHLDLARKEAKDRLLTGAGWEVMHFWGSEVLNTPDDVKSALKVALEGVPKLPRKKKSKLKVPCTGVVEIPA